MDKRTKNQPGVYVPDMGIKYPDYPFERLLEVEVKDSSLGKYRFDDSFPYLDKSFGYKFNMYVTGWAFKWLIASAWNRLHYGLRIKGREKLKKYREALADGAMCVCNHCYEMDALAVNHAVRPGRILWIPMYAKHFNGSKCWYMRYMGGIPIPEEPSGVRPFNEAFDEFHRRKGWMLVFPEAVRWNWYQPIRPFRPGAFSMAWKYNIPVIPFAITYRERKGLHKLFGPKEMPCITITVGEPIFIDKTARRKEELNRVLRQAHGQMVSMAGIIENPWPAVLEEDEAV